jgi:hypothetical protein
VSTAFAIGIVGIGLAVLAVWRMVKPSTQTPPRPPADIDYEVLEEAEREVRDLDSSVTPDDADDHLTDWGPGVPKPRN